MSNESQQEASKRSLLDWFFRLFSDVRGGEGLTVALMMVNIFLAMFAYYVLKTIREGLILVVDGGAELKSYASGIMALVLLLVLPGYNWLTSAVDTRKLLFFVVGFFILCVQGFYLADLAELPIGVVFFVWVGIFSLSVVAQFWSFANEAYSREAGERLFPVIGIGMAGGAFAGSFLAERLFSEGTSSGMVMQVAALLLFVHFLLYALILRRPEMQHLQKGADAKAGVREAVQGFALLIERPYIRLIALLILLLNVVNTTGEYVLSKYVVSMAEDALAQASGVTDPSAWKGRYISAVYGDFFLWVNVISVTLQALVASRLVKFFGIAGVLFALPIVAGGAYLLAAIGVAFSAFRWAKSAENATDYSIMNTARAMLWLPTDRDEKYKAKQTIDTFVVRAGDMLSAGIVAVGTIYLELNPQQFAALNVVLVLVWVALGVLLYRSYQSLAADTDPSAA